MTAVTIYTQLNCSKCDEAYRILMQVACDNPLQIDVIDVTHTHNLHLVSQYQDRIPVVVKPNQPSELAWPFTADELKSYIHES